MHELEHALYCVAVFALGALGGSISTYILYRKAHQVVLESASKVASTLSAVAK